MKRVFKAAVLFSLFALLIGGCDVGINPLIIDGTPVSVVLVVETDQTSYTSVSSVNLQQVLDAIDGFADSVAFYNFTLELVDLQGTPASTALNGSFTINGTLLLQLNGILLSAFGSERSIFDPTLQGATVNSAGVTVLKNLLHQQPLPPVSVGLNGSTSNPLNFRLRVKIYTQIYTTP